MALGEHVLQAAVACESSAEYWTSGWMALPTNLSSRVSRLTQHKHGHFAAANICFAAKQLQAGYIRGSHMRGSCERV